MNVLGVFALLAVLVAVYLAQAPIPHNIQPKAFSSLPSLSKPEGKYAHNALLRQTQRLGHNIRQSETVVFDKSGQMYGFTSDGWVVKIDAKGEAVPYVFIGGRPLAGKFDDANDLIIAVPAIGLVKIVSATKQVIILSNHVGGKPIIFADDLDIASDGKIYFSDASQIGPLVSDGSTYDVMLPSLLNFMEGSKTGRLLMYDPLNGETKVLLENLFFANGVGLSEKEDFVLIAQTLEFNIIRYWLKGDKAGTSDIFIESLVGSPDSLSRSSDGGFWVAVPASAPDSALFLREYPQLREIVLKIPAAVQPKPVNFGLVVKLSSSGEVEQTLWDVGGEVIGHITSVTEHEGYLYFGSVENTFVGKYKI